MGPLGGTDGVSYDDRCFGDRDELGPPLAKALGVPRTRIERLANEETGVTADTALRLSKAFKTTPQLWLNLQNDYDVQTASRAIARELDKIEPVTKRAA